MLYKNDNKLQDKVDDHKVLLLKRSKNKKVREKKWVME
ncbi:hypothetical protein ES703_35476 [subsurface metagenome]